MKRATIRDVAHKARVSSATVSRYLNGNLQLPEETASRIRHAIEALSYAPSVLAQALSTGRSRTLGIIVPDIANPFFAQLASAAEREAFTHGYALMLCSTESHPERERHYLAELRAQRLDGTLFISEYIVGAGVAEQLAGIGNLVLVDEGLEGFGGVMVLVQNAEGARLATEHLLELGHRRIAYVGGPPHLLTSRERVAGFEAALRAAGLTPDPRCMVHGPYRERTGVDALGNFLELDVPPTAVFASSDVAAFGVLREARGRGLRVPGNLSVVGFDDVWVSQMLSPALTTVSQPIDALGAEAIRALLGLIRGEPVSIWQRRLPVRLVTRESTGPLR